VTPHQPVVSGRRLIKALEADGWEVVRQRGSHVRLRKAETRSALVVPVHDELKKGTLARILREAGLHTDDLRRLLAR
jgi:predicted RNA binding protein YcfA (HicA-like mRNA interferase family)